MVVFPLFGLLPCCCPPLLAGGGGGGGDGGDLTAVGVGFTLRFLPCAPLLPPPLPSLLLLFTTGGAGPTVGRADHR